MTSPGIGPDSSHVSIDTSKPSLSRMYDYLLGGGHNFAADRALADRILVVVPDARQIARASRSFLRRAVLYMIEQGITQFIELGPGIPTVGNVHAIAWDVCYDSHVVYVESDPVAISHLELQIGRDVPGVAIVRAAINDPDLVLADIRSCALIDFAKPVGLLLTGAAHCLPDPRRVIAAYQSTLSAGSYFALAHLTGDGRPDLIEAAGLLEDTNTFHLRALTEIRDLFGDMHLVEPGLVPANAWRPEFETECWPLRGVYAGVGRIL